MISLFCDRLDVLILSNVNIDPEDLLEMVLMAINVMIIIKIFMRAWTTDQHLAFKGVED